MGKMGEEGRGRRGAGGVGGGGQEGWGVSGKFEDPADGHDMWRDNGAR